MRVPHDARACPPSGMQREIACMLACVCVCVCVCVMCLSPSLFLLLRVCECVSALLSPPSLLKVREFVEHGRRQVGEVVVGQK
jgi:hypothetical protein